MSNNIKLKYYFELDNIDKPLSESELSQKIQEEKKKATLVHQLSDPDTKAVLWLISIPSMLLIMIFLALSVFSFIPDLISGKMQIFDMITMIIMFSILPFLGYMLIITNIILGFIYDKKYINKLKNDPNYVVNKELNQLNDQLIDKNEPYKVRYLHELIKDGEHVNYQTIVNDDNTCKLIITIDDQFIQFDKNDYSKQDLELMNQYNIHYKLKTNKDAMNFFYHYVNINNHINKDVLNSRFDAQSLQELHDKTEKIKNLAQRN